MKHLFQYLINENNYFIFIFKSRIKIIIFNRININNNTIKLLVIIPNKGFNYHFN